MTNVEALKALCEEVTGITGVVDDCTTIAEILNKIAAYFGSEKEATTNAEAIANIAEVADGIVKPDGRLSIVENGQYNVSAYAEVDVEVEPPEIVAFGIHAPASDRASYCAAGMTFGEYIESQYNDLGLYDDGGDVAWDDKGVCYLRNVSTSDVIQATIYFQDH